MERQLPIAIIGGGASGMLCAITVLQNFNLPVVIIEGQERVGRKLAATGNGRCNLTNINSSLKNFYSENFGFADYALKLFSPADTMDFFNEIGVLPRVEENGRVYPYSNQATSVVDALRFTFEKLGGKLINFFPVNKICQKGNKFIIKGATGEIEAQRVVVATGGIASPSLNANLHSYKLLTDLGHRRTSVFPSLVQLKTDTTFVRQLKGIKIDGIIKVSNSEEKGIGEILFTEYGLSGPAIFDISRVVSKNILQHKATTISVDVMPEYPIEQVMGLIYFRIKSNQNIELSELFTGTLNKRLGQVICKYAGLAPLSRKAGELNQDDVYAIAKAIKDLSFDVIDTMGFGNAQVTAGGIDTRDFNSQTMESNKVSGLFAIGEILDVDGDCGGFNLQWSWSSAYIAGLNVGKGLAK